MRYKDFKKFRIKSKERFRELYYFAMQYPEWKDQLDEITVIGSPEISGMPHGSGVGNPTERIGVEKAELLSKVTLIEQCVKDADPTIYKGLLKGVTTPGCTPNTLRARGYLHCGNEKYYHARGKFYWLLDQRKG